jgi:DNA-binding response OmpR family regulator
MKTMVVDDDKNLADIIAFTFKREGYEVILAEDGNTALHHWRQDKPDLIILDVNIPTPDGFSVCNTIRKEEDTPIIILTVRSTEEDIIHGLDIGADDYITKPFSPRQLMARVEAVLRRANPESGSAFRELGKFFLDLNRHTLKIDNFPAIQLTALEFRLFDCLMINSGQIVNPEIIVEYVWGASGGNRDMVRQLVHRLRNKIGIYLEGTDLIETIPGLGYSLLPEHKISNKNNIGSVIQNN